MEAALVATTAAVVAVVQTLLVADHNDVAEAVADIVASVDVDVVVVAA